MDVAKIDEVGVGSGDDCEDKKVERLLSKNSNRATGYLTSDTRQAFTQLRQTFIKLLILQYFDMECHIRIETDASGYAIGKVLSQLNWSNLGQ